MSIKILNLSYTDLSADVTATNIAVTNTSKDLITVPVYKYIGFDGLTLISNYKNRIVFDESYVTDLAVFAFEKYTNDQVSVTSKTQLSFAKNLSDVFGITDDFIKEFEYHRVFNDPVSVSEELSWVYVKNLNSIATIVEQLALDIELPKSSYANVNSDFQKVVEYVREFDQSSVLVDSVLVNAVSKNIFDIQVVDSTATIDVSKGILDFVSNIEDEAIFTFVKNTTDPVGFVEQMSYSLEKGLSSSIGVGSSISIDFVSGASSVFNGFVFNGVAFNQ